VIQDIKTAMNDEHGSVGAWFKNVILTEGIEYKPFALNPQAAQLLETRKFTRSEIASIYRVPPHMIGDLEKATFSNIEQQSTDFAMFCILPWVTRWEQEINRKLLTGSQYCKFNLNTLMRGDMAARFASYQIGRQWGWLSANDIRHLEDMDPLEGIAGAAYLVPLNYQLASDLDKPKPEAPRPGTDPAPGEPEDDDEQDDGDEKANKDEGSEAAPDPVTNFAPLVDDLISRATNRLYNGLADKYPKRGAYWPEESREIFNKFKHWFLDQVKVIAAAGYKFDPLPWRIDYEAEPNRDSIQNQIQAYLKGDKKNGN
jgi:hypothetical protein